MNSEDFRSDLERLDGLSIEGNDDEWLQFMGRTLKMQRCYLPAAQAVLKQGRWRAHSGKGQNTIGYFKTATYREAMKMGLALRKGTTIPRIPTKDRPQKNAQLAYDEDLAFNRRDTGQGLVDLPIPKEEWNGYEEHVDRLHALSYVPGTYHRTERGAWREGGLHNDDDYRGCRVPEWLQIQGNSGIVDWFKVARYAATKPSMVLLLARVLQMKATGVSRPRAVAMASTRTEARKIEAMWKWVDRNLNARIKPLFRMVQPPEPKITQNQGADEISSSFLPPAEALRSTLHRHKLRSQRDRQLLVAGPSLQVPLCVAANDRSFSQRCVDCESS